MQPVRRDDVAGEAAGAARRDVARERRQRVFDRDQASVRIERLREIAFALERRRHAVETHLSGLLHLRRFHRVEEEQLLLAALTPESRNLHRAADVESRRVVLLLRLHQTEPIVLPGRRVPRVAPAVPVSAAVIIRAPALGDDLDVRARRVAELRLVAVEEHLHLGDGVEVDRRVHAVRARQLVAVQAVDRHLVPRAPLAADVRQLRAEAVAHRLDVVLVMDARQQPQEVDDVAPLGLNLLNLRRRQQPGVVAVLRLDDRAARRHGHDFRQGADIELDAAEIELAARVQHVAPLLECLKALELDAQRIRAGPESAEREIAAVARDDRACVAGRFVDERDGRARQHLGGCVDDGAGDGAGVLPRGRTRRGQQDNKDRSEDQGHTLHDTPRGRRLVMTERAV